MAHHRRRAIFHALGNAGTPTPRVCERDRGTASGQRKIITDTMASAILVRFDTSHLSPQDETHIRYVIENYLRQKGVEYDDMEYEHKTS